MLINNKYHLTYCTNVHPGETWDTTFDSLKKHLPAIKANCSPDAPFGVGLRLSNRASTELGFDEKLMEFSQWLDEHDFYVFTINGFPFGDFHNKKVKDLVHAPDWATYERLEYTLRLVAQLAYLLPTGVNGGISTSPISYKHWHSSEDMKENTFKKGALNLSKMVESLYHLECETEKYIHIDIEPEPDGLLENSNDIIDFFREYLLPIGTDYLRAKLNKSNEESEQMLFKYINVCYDICHFSLAFEKPATTIKRLKQTGIKIGKVQVSSALKVIFDGEDDDVKLRELLRFDEPVYLHQVTEKRNGKVRTYQDLPALLNKQREYDELRAHFHVPIFLEAYGRLDSTQDQILEFIKCLRLNEGLCEHLEIETYTWEILPDDLKTAVEDSVNREIWWFKNELEKIYEENSSH